MPTQAAEWDVNGGVTTSALFTDNFCMVPNGNDEEVIGTLTPNINLTGQGARARMSLLGGVELNTIELVDTECPQFGFGGGQFANRESVVPNIGFNSDLELIRDTLTLTADAEARQNPINPFLAGGNDALNGRDNTNISYRYGAGAILQRRLASAADMQLQYQYSEQYNAVALFGDTVQHQADFNLGTRPERSRLTLGIGANYSRIEVEATDLAPAFDNELSRAELRAGLRLSQSFELTARGGEEWNEFLTAGTGEIDGTYWDVGFVWTPNSRVVVSAGTGERFLGDTPRADISWRHKRSALRLAYQRTVTFPFDLRAPGRQNAQDPALDEFLGDDFATLPGDPLLVRNTPTFIGDSPILVESLQFSYGFNARRTRFSLTASESLQTRAADLGEGIFRNAGITASRTLSSMLSLNLGLSWQETEGRGGNVGLFGQNAETWMGTLGLSRRIASRTNLLLNYQYTDRQSDFELNTFEENRIILSVSHQFR